MSTTRAVSVALWTQDSAQHPEMMCAYRTPDQSYCKFNTNYSNNILITWGEVKNNAVIPPGAGPSPLRAGHFQLLCQSTAGFVWLWQRAHNSPKSLGSSGYSPSSIWAGSAQEKVEPNPPWLSQLQPGSQTHCSTLPEYNQRRLCGWAQLQSRAALTTACLLHPEQDDHPPWKELCD